MIEESESFGIGSVVIGDRPRTQCQVVEDMIHLYAHLNRDKIESNLSVPGIQGHQENALIKSFKMSPHLICLYASIKIPLRAASGSSLDSGWP